MKNTRRIFSITLIGITVSIAGGWGGYHLYQERKAYVNKKRRERKRAYRGSNAIRRGSGKRAGDTVDAWKEQFKK